MVAWMCSGGSARGVNGGVKLLVSSSLLLVRHWGGLVFRCGAAGWGLDSLGWPVGFVPFGPVALLSLV